MRLLLHLLFLLFVSGAVRRKNVDPPTSVDLDRFGFQPTCVSCTALVSVISLALKFDFSEPVVLELATVVCKLFAKQSWAVCDGISSQFRDEFFYVFRRLAKESPSQICGIILPDCADPTDPSESGWIIPLPPVKSSRTATRAKKGSKKGYMNILQLTDLHIDFAYVYPSDSQCSDPVCCRKLSGKPSKQAGYWGTVGKCDIPYWTVEHMLTHISQTNTIDMIFMTGDYINHVDWEYTVEEHLSVLRKLHATITRIFPTTPVYWALGNHEGVPVNSFAPHTVDERFWPDWLYKEMRAMSTPWIDSSAEQQILKRGSYADTIIDGLKIISLNTGFCEVTNFFLYLNQSDPDSTMSWFVGELLEAEERGEKVLVLAHIPPGDSECLEGWSRNYYRIIQRFHNTISAQFFGHDHLDYFTVFYEDMHDVSSRPISVAYASPSVTTFEDQNPAYRIYQMDPDDGFTIVDFTTYSTNLEKATKENEPVWKELYSAKKEYSMLDLSPKSWNKVAHRIFKSEKIRDKFTQFAFRTKNPKCDETCRLQLLCNLRMGHHNSTLYCPKF